MGNTNSKETSPDGTSQEVRHSPRKRTCKNVCSTCYPQQRQQEPALNSVQIPVPYRRIRHSEKSCDYDGQTEGERTPEHQEQQGQQQQVQRQETTLSHSTSAPSTKDEWQRVANTDRQAEQEVVGRVDFVDQPPEPVVATKSLASAGVAAGSWGSVATQPWKKRVAEQWQGAKDGKANLDHWPRTFYPQYFLKDKYQQQEQHQQQQQQQEQHQQQRAETGGTEEEKLARATTYERERFVKGPCRTLNDCLVDEIDHADPVVREKFRNDQRCAACTAMSDLIIASRKGIGGECYLTKHDRPETDYPRNAQDAEEEGARGAKAQGEHQEQPSGQSAHSDEEGREQASGGRRDDSA